MNLLQEVFFTFFLAVIVYFIFEWITRDRVNKIINKIPGPIRVPIIGTTYRLFLFPKEELFKRAKVHLRNYGPIIRTWLGSTPVVHLLEPKDIELILNNSVQITKSSMYDSVRPWLGDGLLTSTGKKWFTHRKLITPTFHFTILENFMEIFVEKSKLLVTNLQNKTSTEVFDLYPHITNCTLDIICETAMGIQINAMSDPNNEYVKNVSHITKETVDRLMKPWLHPDFIYYKTNQGKRYKKYLSNLHDFTTKVIKERKEKLITKSKTDQTNESNSSEPDVIGGKVRKAFLDLLLESPINLTDMELREEVDTFMFEGHDTTTAGICWSLFLLGNHPDIQEEVFREITTVFEESNDGETLTINDLGKLKLLERCVKEALRLFPSVPTIGRKLTNDVKLEKYLLPAECTINLQIFLVHHDEKIYPHPEKFDPDRFLPDNIKNRHPYAYIPFSAGPRNCIGQKFAMYEEKTILAYILKHYKVTAIESQETVKPMMELILRPKNGLLVKLESRKS
nr:cytochrome P450 4C1-like [Onthophagus taurus]